MQRVFALTGLGGMGKTQTAIRYVFKHRERYRIVLWAHADGQSKLAESFSLFADKLGLGKGMSNTKAKKAVKDCLKIVSKCASKTVSSFTSDVRFQRWTGS